MTTPLTAAAIAAADAYIPEGVTQFYWVPYVTGSPGIADITAPTLAELNAASVVDLTDEIAAMGNWGVTSAAVDKPNLKSRFVPNVPGLITIDGPTLSVYLSQTDDVADVRSILPRDTPGQIVKFPEGAIEGYTCDIFDVTVASISKPTALGGTVAVAEITFTVTAEPAENVVVPSA